MIRRLLAALLFIGCGVAAADDRAFLPDDFAVFPPRHASIFFQEIDCGSGGMTSAGDSSGWIASAAAAGGAGSAVQGLTSTTPGTGTSTGHCQFNTGTTNAGRASISTQSAAGPINFANGQARFFAAFDEGTASDGTDTYTARVGFIDSVSAEPTDGCFFRYTSGVNSGKWQIVARQNSTETALDSQITFTATTRRTFGVKAVGGTSCAFYNAGVLITPASGTNPIATNVPTGNSRTTGAGIGVIKSAGTTDTVPFYLDYMAVEQRPTTPRGWVVP